MYFAFPSRGEVIQTFKRKNMWERMSKGLISTVERSQMSSLICVWVVTVWNSPNFMPGSPETQLVMRRLTLRMDEWTKRWEFAMDVTFWMMDVIASLGHFSCVTRHDENYVSMFEFWLWCGSISSKNERNRVCGAKYDQSDPSRQGTQLRSDWSGFSCIRKQSQTSLLIGSAIVVLANKES